MWVEGLGSRAWGGDGGDGGGGGSGGWADLRARRD
jgi:hypothetical protein